MVNNHNCSCVPKPFYCSMTLKGCFLAARCKITEICYYLFTTTHVASFSFNFWQQRQGWWEG
jgi:hypothetical protein